MNIIHKKSHFRDYLERIIFNQEELKELAKYITQLTEKKISSEQYKTILLESRVRILNDITEFVNFYTKTQLNSKSISTHHIDELETELKDKTILLEDIAKKLKKIDKVLLK